MALSLNKPKLDNLAGDIWKSAERLRGKFKAYEYLDGVKQDGRSKDNHLGRLVGDDCRRLGVHVCRSFGWLLLNRCRWRSAAHWVDPR